MQRAALASVKAALAPLGYRSSTLYIEGLAEGEVAAMGYYSQFGQDVLVDRHLFAGRRGGVFVDVGAHDGKSFSNSMFFERERGWTGLCVEPNPEVFTELRANRACACVNVAVAATEGHMPFLVAPGGVSMLSGLEPAYDARHRRRLDRETAARGGPTTVRVPTQRLDVLAREHGIARIDLLNIDVEGGEAGVLDSLELREFSVGLVVIENQFRSWPIARRILRQGYRLIARLQSDEVYAQSPLRLSGKP